MARPTHSGQICCMMISVIDQSPAARRQAIVLTCSLLQQVTAMNHPTVLFAVFRRSLSIAVTATNRLATGARRAAMVLVLMALQSVPVAANAAPFTPTDASEVRKVVAAQLAAFAADDAARAFSYAAPNVRQAVGDAAGFLAMVQSGYPVVYRPASVAFLKANGKDDDAIQRVQMTDAAGESWLAIYSLQRQKNKVWRITGCSVVENKGRMA